jgi:long-subunit acyl-CoA synthetase (AMP-forming)
MTFRQVETVVEALSYSFIKHKLCPRITSNCEGTPDLKFLAIFAENRPEWYISELAAVSDSVCIVPVAVEQQFLSHKRIAKLLNDTQATTIAVSAKTISSIL